MHYTQNIDTLENVAGIKKVTQCHGSFATATCLNCKYKVDGRVVRKEIMKQKIPYCMRCKDGRSFYKPDIIFFGEQLQDSFFEGLESHCEQCDLVVVIGSSLKVQPVALIPRKMQ